MKKKPVSDDDKKEFIEYYYENPQELEQSDENVKAAYRVCVEEGVSKDWIVALTAKAYACYGGNCIYECDWEASRDLLLRLVELDGENNPFYYNTLGYIFYYGRCNNGEPQYDEAFKYFSVGAIAGIFESRYKMADMLMGGKGVPKNLRSAATMIIGMYDENYDIFCKGGYDGKFADVSLRMGGLYEYGTGLEKNLELAYYHYLQAEYAIKLRSERYRQFGDGKVRERITQAAARVRAQLPEDFFKDHIEFENPAMFGLMLQGCSGLDIELDYRRGRYYLKGRTLAAQDDVEENLITVAEMEFCELADEVEMELVGVSDVSSDDFPQKAFITHILFDDETGLWEFYHGDYSLLSFKCTGFLFRGVFGRHQKADISGSGHEDMK